MSEIQKRKNVVNTKEYIELCQSENINKKHKGVSKGETSMDLSSFGKRINSVGDIENFGQLKKDTVNQSRFTVKKNKIILETVEKSKFAQINDKRYYFEDGIISLPFSHPYLNEIIQYKEQKKQRIENWIQDEKENLLKMEKEALLKNHRLSTLQ